MYSLNVSLQFVVYRLLHFFFILNAESIIDTWNIPAKTKMESNKRREGMNNIIDFTLDFSGVRVAKRLVFCVVFCTSLFGLCPFSFGHCIASLSSIYGL